MKFAPVLLEANVLGGGDIEANVNVVRLMGASNELISTAAVSVTVKKVNVAEGSGVTNNLSVEIETSDSLRPAWENYIVDEAARLTAAGISATADTSDMRLAISSGGNNILYTKRYQEVLITIS